MTNASGNYPTESNPLAWPDYWPRHTPAMRGKAIFRSKFSVDRDEVIHRLKARGAKKIIITTDLPLRIDGLPLAGRTPPSDPGISVWWIEKGRERVMACDRWRDVGHNMDRWGASEIAERAFAGFTALPPGSPAPSASKIVDWRKVLEVDEDAVRRLMGDAFSTSVLLSVIKTKYRSLMSTVHPDRGGTDADRAILLNAAMEQAQLELGQ